MYIKKRDGTEGWGMDYGGCQHLGLQAILLCRGMRGEERRKDEYEDGEGGRAVERDEQVDRIDNE